MPNVINATSTGSGGLISTGDDSGILNIQTNETTAITVDASQNVGIGTASPTVNLDINSSAAGGNICAFRSTATNGGYVQFQGSGSTLTTTGYVGAASKLNTGGSVTDFGMTAKTNLVFGTNDGTERMRITSSGYLKASDTGSYLNSGGAYSEVNNSNASNPGFGIGVSNASYVGDGIFMSFSQRSSSSTFNAMQVFTSGGNTLFKFRGDGNAYADGTFNNNGADYAEYFESANGQALTVGATVVLDGSKIREATSQDDVKNIIGVVRPKEPSKASMIVGNTAWNKWANQYLSDDFDRYIMEDHDVVEWTDEDGKKHSYESQNIPSGLAVPSDATRKTHDENGAKFQHYKVNPDWNPDTEYVNRETRPEWNIIGLLGQVKLLKGKPVGDRWIKMRDVSDSVEEWFIR